MAPFKPTPLNFSIFMGLNMGAQILCNSYSKAVMPQLEKRFGLTSTLTGSLVFAKTLGGIVCLIGLSIFGQNISHRPRAIAIASCVAILGACLAPLPHFIGEAYDPGVIDNRIDNVANSTVSKNIQNMCQIEDIEHCDTTNSKDVQFSTENKKSVSLFFVSEFLYGIGSGPILPLAMPYLHDNAPSAKSTQYFSLLMAVPTYGWMLSYWSAGHFAKIWVDFPAEAPAGITQKDAGWVGCWWLGYILFTPILILCTLPIFAFPKQLEFEFGDDVEQEKLKEKHDQLREEDEKYIEEFKKMGVFKRAKKIVSNKLMVSCQIGSVISMYSAYAYLYRNKYLEQQFHLSTEKASKWSIAAGPSAMIGMLAGGYFFSSVMNLNAWSAKKPVIYCLWISTVLGAFRLFVGCDSYSYRGYTTEKGQFDWEENCHCKMGKLDKVCDSQDGSLAYLTACHARCNEYEIKDDNTTIYSGCYENSMVSDIYCNEEPKCKFGGILGYILGDIIVSLPSAFFTAPFMMIFLGTMPASEKAVALAVFKLVQKLFGSLWAGTVIGWVFERGCVLFAKDDCGNQGNCLIYDNNILRITLWGYVIIIGTLSLIVWTFLLLIKPVKGSAMYRDMIEAERKKSIKNRYYAEQSGRLVSTKLN